MEREREKARANVDRVLSCDPCGLRIVGSKLDPVARMRLGALYATMALFYKFAIFQGEYRRKKGKYLFSSSVFGLLCVAVWPCSILLSGQVTVIYLILLTNT